VDIIREKTMRLLRVAVEKRRWDLAAHTIVLATVNVLRNGDKPPASKRVSNSSSSRTSGVKRVTETKGKRI